jgi:NADP-dependent 3-hydroxy acid dehydrogenase YdfG
VLVHDIVVSFSQPVVLEITSKSYAEGRSTIFCHFDCTSKQSWIEALELAKSKFGRLDIVINNAETTYHKADECGGE